MVITDGDCVWGCGCGCGWSIGMLFNNFRSIQQQTNNAMMTQMTKNITPAKKILSYKSNINQFVIKSYFYSNIS